uniref:Progestin and adipoQ receptor family member 6 n=1 Tax=Oryzias latipes TaxID=8090 RepID=A0A3B3HER9_ORYLA
MAGGRVFPVWRGIGASSSISWSQEWSRCLKWEFDSRDGGPRIPVFDYPIWFVFCRGGRARIREVYQRGRGAIRLPTDIFDIHQVPKVFREDGIISGYRHPRSSALDCILSSFQMNNETINIWTHFLPTWWASPLFIKSTLKDVLRTWRYFLWRFFLLGSTMDFLSDSYAWPLLVYMLLICVYPFTSCCAHIFSTMSPESRHICYFFDYGALSLYSLGCAISYGFYVMPDCWVNSWIQQHFIPIAIGNSLLCTSMSCYSRFVELQFPQRSKALRTGAFVVPFLFDTVPLFYRVLLSCWGSCSLGEALSNHCYHLLFAFLTCFLFTAHLPERLAPGRFDYFGHSHQLFHVSAVVGTHFQMEGVLADMSSRRQWLQTHGLAPSFLSTFGALVLSFVLNLGIIAVFSALLLWKPRPSCGQQHAPTCGCKEQ